MTDLAELRSKLQSLEFQLRVLQAQLSRVESTPDRETDTPFAALEGIWKGQGRFSFEEIQAAELKLPPDL